MVMLNFPMNKAWIPTSIRHYSCYMSLLETACGRLTIQRYTMQPANGDLRSCQHDCHAMTQPKDLSVATAEPERKVVIWLIDSSPSAVLSCTPAHAGNSQAGDKPMAGGHVMDVPEPYRYALVLAYWYRFGLAQQQQKKHGPRLSRPKMRAASAVQRWSSTQLDTSVRQVTQSS